MRTKTLILLLMLPTAIFAHDGHGTSEKKNVSSDATYFSNETVSDKYELLLKYAPVLPQEETHFTLFLSDYATNAPTDSAVLKISSPDDLSLQFEVEATEPGVYSVHALFPEKKTYRLNVNIDGRAGADLLALSGVEVGKVLQQQADEAASWWEHPAILLLAGAFAGGILVLLAMKGSRKSKAAGLLVIFAAAIVSGATPSAFAHGDEVHTTGSSFGNSIVVPKETQFLFGMLTQKVTSGDFTASVALTGTIIPSSNGRAVVQSTQSGKIHSLNVAVGQSVVKGQLLAIVEPVIDPASMVNFASERNAVNAEFEAAKKNYDRLLALKDIAAQKDFEDAKARYETAQSNKELLDKLANGDTDPSRLVYLRSPISGVVDPFTFTVGSTINAGETILSVTDLSVVYIEAQVFSENISRVSEAQQFTAEKDGSTISDTIRKITTAQNLDVTNQSQKVIFELQNADGQYRIGEFVILRAFATASARHISVPNTALNEVNGKMIVFVKDNAEHYSLRYIEPGNNNGSSTVIQSGISEGERVVTDGTYQMKMIYLNQ